MHFQPSKWNVHKGKKEKIKALLGKDFIPMAKNKVKGLQGYYSSPLSTVSLSVLLVTCGQPLSKNIKLEIPERNFS